MRWLEEIAAPWSPTCHGDPAKDSPPAPLFDRAAYDWVLVKSHLIDTTNVQLILYAHRFGTSPPAQRRQASKNPEVSRSRARGTVG